MPSRLLFHPGDLIAPGITFVSDAGSVNGARQVTARCYCGTAFTTSLALIRRRKTRSCGCLNLQATRERSTRHGGYGTPLYRFWERMVTRCGAAFQAREPRYAGVTIHEPWRDFTVFRDDIGSWHFPGAALARMRLEGGAWICDDGGYRPGNVCWITRGENTRQTAIRRYGWDDYVPPPDVVARWHAMNT